MSEKKLRFAVAGVGDMGNGHIDGVQRSDYGELVALMDPAGPACLDRRRQYPACCKSPIPTVPIYTDYKDLSVEQKVETVLDKYGIFYTKSETWIESEKFYEILYSFDMEA